MLRLKFWAVLVAFLIIACLFGYFVFFLPNKIKNSFDIEKVNTQSDLTSKSQNSDRGKNNWITYIDQQRYFEIQLPTNIIEKSGGSMYFDDLRDDRVEVISSGGNFPEVSVEISDVENVLALPTNFEVKSETTSTIGGRLNIQATKKFGYFNDTYSKQNTLVAYYLIFERNGETYLLKYSPNIFRHEENIAFHKEVFNKIVDSLKFSGPMIIPNKQLEIIGSQSYYKDEQQRYIVPVPPGWFALHGGDDYDPSIIITNAPTQDIYTYDGRFSKYKRVYITKSGAIFSTSGTLCGNASCRLNGVFNTRINNVDFSTDILLNSDIQNRLLFQVDIENKTDFYIGASYPKGSSYSDIQYIISNIQIL